MKLFVRHDLERCARLATQFLQESPPEVAVQKAVQEIVTETEPVYPKYTVLEVAQRAARLMWDEGRGGGDPDNEDFRPLEIRMAERAFEEVVG